jgi:hypothetical protein
MDKPIVGSANGWSRPNIGQSINQSLWRGALGVRYCQKQFPSRKLEYFFCYFGKLRKGDFRWQILQ